MRKLRNLLCTTFVLLFSFQEGIAQVPFTPGNIVVLRVNDGSSSLNPNLAHPVFLDEYTTSGVLVQSIALPTTVSGANNPFTLNGYDGNNIPDRQIGMLSLSPNGQWLATAGFGVSPSLQPWLYDPNRTIALIDYNGIINTSTKLSTPLTDAPPNTPVNYYNSTPFSAITTNGTDIWTCFQNEGILYTTTGSSTYTTIVPQLDIPGTGTFYRILGISNNQLYITSNQGRVRAVGTGLPTTGPQGVVSIPGGPPILSQTGQMAFFFADLNPAIPGNDVLYVVHDQTGLQKYSFDGTNWASNGTVGGDADDYFSITGTVNGSTVSLYCTRKQPYDGITAAVSGGELVTLTDASGHNGTLTGTPTVLFTAPAQTRLGGVCMAPKGPSVKVAAKAFLQGAYNTSVSRHKDVTTAWVNVLNANALTQPFNVAPFNYAGTEQVSAGFFTSNSGATTDITDWVLVELRDKNNPATVVSRRAGLIREDGRIVATDGVSDLTLTNTSDDSYYIVIRHRNHLAVRSANPVALNGSTATLYDFTTAQSQAYQNPSVPGNTAMATKDLPGTETGKFLLWGGNANGDGFIRASGASNVSDYLTLLGPLCLQGDFSKILNSVYRKEDMNLDGVVRASAALNVNDYITLLSTGILAGNTSNIIAAH